MTDFYEFLQISPHADSETIHRVYRYLAARFHPDNPDSGNVEAFQALRTAYDVLSDRKRRAEYDASRTTAPSQQSAKPMFTSIDFLDGFEGEINRRLAVLAVLYFRRREQPNAPEVSFAEIESRMGFPRDYLDFTTWYLVRKGYITRADNYDFTLTADGVDYVETQRTQLPVLQKLLADGCFSIADAASHHKNGASRAQIALPALTDTVGERRVSRQDRRQNTGERRAGNSNRRASDRQ